MFQYFNRVSWAIKALSATNQHHAKQLIYYLITELSNGELYYTHHSQQGLNVSFQALLVNPQVFSDKDSNNDITFRYTAYHT